MMLNFRSNFMPGCCHVCSVAQVSPPPVFAADFRRSNELPNASERLIAGDEHHRAGLHLRDASANLSELRRLNLRMQR